MVLVGGCDFGNIKQIVGVVGLFPKNVVVAV